MTRCIHCAEDLQNADQICRACGQAVAPEQTVPHVHAEYVEDATTEATSVPAVTAPSQESADVRRSSVTLIVGAVAALAVGAVLTSMLLRVPSLPHASPARADVATIRPPQSSANADEGPTVAAPKWSSANRLRWVTNRPKNVAFELEAENKVAVWLGQVRPVLVVRCHARNLDVFVYTESAARIEPQDEDHTVRIAFDDQPESTERWPDSSEHDALFAPDGAAFVRRLAHTRTLRFGFAPHNAQPAVAVFDVSGFDKVVAGLRDCIGEPPAAVTKVASR